MSEDRLPADQADQAAGSGGRDPACDGTGERRPAIVVVGRDASEREALRRELSKRYGADYQIVVCDEPAEVEPKVRGLLRARAPVALVIGGAGEADPDGIEVLAVVRGIDPTASRVAAVGWGERDTARSRELRDTFSRSGIPIGFYDANTERGRQILRELGAESAEPPVVVLRFGGQRPTLVNPSNLEITGTRSYA